MPHSFGYRGKTRHLFKRPFRSNGPEHLSTYLQQYKKGMFVDIVANGSIHKGMPHKFYHGRTGRVFDISPNSIGVIVNKQVRNRIVEKRIHVRVEHLKISTCNPGKVPMLAACSFGALNTSLEQEVPDDP